MQKPTLRALFTRDFTLVNMEIWWRGEVRNDKIWTSKRQPFLPYIVFERKDGVVRSFYDERGIHWIKQLLLENTKKEAGFLHYIERNFLSYLIKLRSLAANKTALNHDDFLSYLKVFEDGYVWFEAGWWLWDLTEQELDGLVLPEWFKKIREGNQDFVPMIENLIRETLKKLYPTLENYIEVLRISEIAGNNFPPFAVLEARNNHYFFFNDEIYTDFSRADIEDRLGIVFEKEEGEESEVTEIKGESAFPGKVTGRIKIIWSAKNISKCKDGDIMVSPMTLPDLLLSIKKCSAIVTDEGGMLSHAAIISRELKKPCVIGTRIATKVLKDGDLVEVDAVNGIIKILKRASDEIQK